jgi:hypothetical protein
VQLGLQCNLNAWLNMGWGLPHSGEVATGYCCGVSALMCTCLLKKLVAHILHVTLWLCVTCCSSRHGHRCREGVVFRCSWACSTTSMHTLLRGGD